MKEEPKNLPLAAVLIFRALFFMLAAAVLFTGSGVTCGDYAEPGRDLDALAVGASARGQRWVVPLGRTVGIKLFSDGVMVVGLSEIATENGMASPAAACGLQTGDIITHINSSDVDSIEEVRSLLQSISGEKMSLRVLREEKQVQLTAQAVQCSADGAYKLGAWIRDSMAGIGTTTFYDPENGVFGALGHGINDVDTALLMPLQSGSIMYASVVNVKKGVSGKPGELQGTFEVNRDMGELYANTVGGVFGILSDKSLADGMEPVPVARRKDVKTGPAVILSNISGNCVEEYSIEIVRIYPDEAGRTRDLMLKVTDPRLLESTGGIVQGMSGSPILQNGAFVGAVTHVLVNDPTQGYGILAEHMLDASNVSKNARIA
jgi:stage IV sporulation protein B